MCGIIAYTGEKEAYPILLSGLEKLEYRGYDSWGIAICIDQEIIIKKKIGRIGSVDGNSLGIKEGCLGIGHTRWATTGQVKDNNAHPFTDTKNQFSLVHNGIIENYLELKEELRKEGISFTSDTDSEVMVHLIAKYYQGDPHGDFREAVLKTISRLQGAYAFCVIKNDSKEIIGGRNGSPLVVGLGNGENFLASDVSALIEHSRKVIYLHDSQIAKITPTEVEISNFNGQVQKKEIKEINWTLEQARKSGYKHFMLKEIFEQPKVVEETLGVKLPALPKENISRIIFVACGTASHAGLVGKYLIEKIAKIPVVNEIASEFRYKENLLNENDLVIAISQSGETADTLAAIRLAKEKGAGTLGIINVVDSTISREVEEVIYTRAGPEIGVASTKAFLSQLIILYRLAYQIAGKDFVAEFQGNSLLQKIEKSLLLSEEIKSLGRKYYAYQNFLYIGRNLSYPLALEGALKLKEISYIHAEAYPAGELKHGPISLVSEEVPTLAICPHDAVYEKTFNNIQEIRARNGKVIALATEGDTRIAGIADDVIYIPKVEEIFYPLLLAIALQLFAYHIADLRECDCDHPRNLAKACTVE